MPNTSQPARRSVSFIAGLAVALFSCGGSSSDDDSPAYAERGRFAVGVTTVSLSDRDVEVYYPADPDAVSGRPTASYVSFEVLPPAIVGILPPDLNLEIAMDAYQDVPISPDGPFGILTFSHGASGFRHAYSGFLTRLASHGLVVASIDHLEWGLLEAVGLRDDDAVDRETADVVRDTIDALASAGGSTDSPLSGGVDAGNVATAGHSAGGRAAFALPDDPAIKAMIGYATGSARGVETDKPILLLVGSEDGGATRLEEAYDGLSAPRRFVSIDVAGHNSFTDQCAIIHGGNNFLDDLVAAGFPIPENLLALAIDGCVPRNLAPARFWEVSSHFTIATIREAFGLDDPAVGLGDGIATAFDGVTLSYRHDP